MAITEPPVTPPIETLRPLPLSRGPMPYMAVPANYSGHSWTNTSSTGTVTLNDTADYLWGTQAVKLVTAGTNATSCHATASGLSLDMTGRAPVLWVKVDDVTALRALEVRLGDSTFTNFFYLEVESNATASRNDRYMRSGVWHRLPLGWGALGTTTGTPTRAYINQVRVTALDYGTGAATVHLAGFGWQPEPLEYPNGVCCFTFDDGYASQYTTARPVLDQYGYPATALPIVDIIGSNASYMTIAQLRELQDYHGWDIGAHANTQAAHNAAGAFSSLTAAQLDNELRLNKQWLRRNGFRAFDLAAYPQGIHNDAVIAAYKQYYAMSRTQVAYRRDTLPVGDPYRIRTFNLGNTLSLANATAAVDEAAANREFLIFTAHDIMATGTPSTGSQWAASDFASLVAYVAGKNMAVRTLSEALRRI